MPLSSLHRSVTSTRANAKRHVRLMHHVPFAGHKTLHGIHHLACRQRPLLNGLAIAQDGVAVDSSFKALVREQIAAILARLDNRLQKRGEHTRQRSANRIYSL